MPVESRGAPYPVGTDVATVAAYIQNLASWANLRPGITTMTSGARAALSGIELWDHRYVGETDTGKLMARWQSNWVEIADLDTFPTRLFPVGGLGIWATDVAPAGWLLCDGASYPRTGATLELFNVIGTRYGSLDGSSFSVPNLKGRVVVARDAGQTEFDVVGETGGAKTVALTQAQGPTHNHTQTAHTHTGTSDGESADHYHNVSTGVGSTSWENTSHTHPVNINTSDPGNHTHQYVQASGGNLGSSGTAALVNPFTGNTAGAGAHTHSVNGNTGGISANHSHTFNVNSGYRSAGHTHTFSTGSAAPAIQNSGSGTAHENMPPFMVMAYIIKT